MDRVPDLSLTPKQQAGSLSCTGSLRWRLSPLAFTGRLGCARLFAGHGGQERKGRETAPCSSVGSARGPAERAEDSQPLWCTEG